MVKKHLLEDGLAIISQCKRRTGDIWHAHYGAAAIASYFFAQEDHTNADLVGSVTRQAESMLARHRLERSG